MSDSIGARLRQARELRHLTLPQVSETTKLRTHYLQALENDDYSAIPSAAQARGFLRVYAEFLELDLAELLPAPAPQPAPPTPAVSTPKAVTASSGSSGIFGALRQRFSRPKKAEAKQNVSGSVAADVPPESAVEAPAVVAADAQTAPHRRSAPTEVKKNALGK